jgi:hypothetical protein
LNIINDTDVGVEITIVIELTRVTGSEELIRVMSAFASPANRFGSREFEVERGCLVGGHRRYGAVEPTGASSGHCILRKIKVTIMCVWSRWNTRGYLVR